MKFEDALNELKNGRRVRRKSWGSICYLRFSELQQRIWSKIGNSEEETIFDTLDVIADDWEVVSEGPEGHNFQWALDRIKQGLRVHRIGTNHWYWRDGKKIMTNTNKFALLGSDNLLANDWVLADDEK